MAVRTAKQGEKHKQGQSRPYSRSKECQEEHLKLFSSPKGALNAVVTCNPAPAK